MAVYAFIDITGQETRLNSTIITFTGTWTSTGTYARLSAVIYNARNFIATGSNINQVPPATSIVTTPTLWSPLVQIQPFTPAGSSTQLYSDVFLDPNSRLTPKDPLASALYYVDDGTNVGDWRWSPVFQRWYPVVT